MKTCLPTDIKFDDPTVTFSVTYPIRFKIFNFVKFVSNIDSKAFLQGNTILPCNSAGSGFIDSNHRNIVTLDLQIVGNKKLRNLFTKSTKYRETNYITWEKA